MAFKNVTFGEALLKKFDWFYLHNFPIDLKVCSDLTCLENVHMQKLHFFCMICLRTEGNCKILLLTEPSLKTTDLDKLDMLDV